MLMVKILLLSYWLTLDIYQTFKEKKPLNLIIFVRLKILGIISISILNCA